MAAISKNFMFSSPGADPKKSVQECASLFAYAMAAATAIASMTTGVAGQDFSANGNNNVAVQSIPDVLTMGQTFGRDEQSKWWGDFGTYDWHKVYDFVRKHDTDGDGELSLSELNKALKEEGFDIQISKDAFDRFDNGYSGTKRAIARGDFMRANDVGDGKLTADELGHMYDDYVGDELVVKINKDSGKHTLDIADEYLAQHSKDLLDVQNKATQQKADRKDKTDAHVWLNKEFHRRRKKAENGLWGLAGFGAAGLTYAHIKDQKDRLKRLEKQKRDLEEEIERLRQNIENMPEATAVPVVPALPTEFKLRF